MIHGLSRGLSNYQATSMPGIGSTSLAQAPGRPVAGGRMGGGIGAAGRHLHIPIIPHDCELRMNKL